MVECGCGTAKRFECYNWKQLNIYVYGLKWDRPFVSGTFVRLIKIHKSGLGVCRSNLHPYT